MDPYFVEEDNLGPAGTSSGTPQTLMRNISVNVGQSAFLECRVRNLGAKRVLWVRHRDVHILSVGANTFTNDPRFHSRVYEDEGTFLLEIRNTQKADEGTYECQISTKPTKTFMVNLLVTVPWIGISGESSIRHLEKRSSLNLTCTFRAEESFTNPSGTPNHRILWFKDGQMITHPGKRVTIFTKDTSAHSAYTLVSNFVINEVIMDDSGSYHCESLASKSDPVRVHVLVDGESPNAWITNGAIAAAGAASASVRYHGWVLLMISIFLPWIVPNCLGLMKGHLSTLTTRRALK
eukprot:snap_masked-scaffold594_size129171-processed-gene-0.12 protein:Tk01964 transcript:snap_masked-scaffold594_size129171-processed-gene-0.12-mRNA-1 annotation:"neurotrimin-like isoform x2"